MPVRQKNSGYSLTEAIVVLTLVGIVSVAVLGFYINSLKAGYTNEQQLKLVSTMRTFMDEMVVTGSRSHELILYNSSDSADRTEDGRLKVLNDDTDTFADDLSPTGDFAVFVFYELPKPASEDKYRISRLVGYYLEDQSGEAPALVRITIDLSGSPSTDPVETILNNNWSSAARRTIARHVFPLALSDGYTDETKPQLFYKRANEHLAVCGQMLNSATESDTGDWRTRTRTFYFSVTVRS